MRLFSTFLLTLLLTVSSHADSTTPQGFLDEVKLAIATQNADAMLALFHLQGSPPEFVSELKAGLPTQLKTMSTVKSMQLVGPPNPVPPPYARNGSLYGPNLEVKGRVEIRGAGKMVTHMEYGVVDGRYRLAGVKRVGVAVTNDVVRLYLLTPGYVVSATLNGQDLNLSKADSQDIMVTPYLRKGANTLELKWRRKGADAVISPEATLRRGSSQGAEIWEKAIPVEGASGSRTLDFQI